MEAITAFSASAAGYSVNLGTSLLNGRRGLREGRKASFAHVLCVTGGCSSLAVLRIRANSFAPAGQRSKGCSRRRVGSNALLPRRTITARTRASAQESSDVDVEEVKQNFEQKSEESKAAYSSGIDQLKQKIHKVQVSAIKTFEVVRDTTIKIVVEAEKARVVLVATAIGTAEFGKSNLNSLAENGPEPIKEVAATAVNAHLKDNTQKGAKIHDFCLGIPYGALQVAGGLLWFTISGSIDAIRFGVTLGGILLFLSVTSLKVWKEGDSSIPYIKGQAAIASILFVKDARKYLQIGGLFTAIPALASAGILVFYAYVYLSGGNPPKKEPVTVPDDAVA